MTLSFLEQLTVALIHSGSCARPTMAPGQALEVAKFACAKWGHHDMGGSMTCLRCGENPPIAPIQVPLAPGKVADVNVPVLFSALVPGNLYFCKSRGGRWAQFSGFNSQGEAIVHPPGEPDMQSSWFVQPGDLFLKEPTTP